MHGPLSPAPSLRFKSPEALSRSLLPRTPESALQEPLSPAFPPPILPNPLDGPAMWVIKPDGGVNGANDSKLSWSDMQPVNCRRAFRRHQNNIKYNLKFIRFNLPPVTAPECVVTECHVRSVARPAPANVRTRRVHVSAGTSVHVLDPMIP